MKNLSPETIKQELTGTFIKDYKELILLDTLHVITEAGGYSGGFYLETLIELKHTLAHDVASMLDIEPDSDDYDEDVDCIDLTIGDLLEAETCNVLETLDNIK